ncbi:hypothetical protein [Terricaulis sp.]|uniref:hypothetical protein n=1 Tax=Terricaulis sp. TaxID=2768686 RepID=UPI00378496DF
MMRTPSLVAAALAALVVSGCASLTAPAPLFTTADQIGPTALSEGVWIGVDEDCPARAAARRSGRFQRGCDVFEIRRTEDGAWTLTGRTDLMSAPPNQDATNEAVVFVLAPVSEHPSPDAYAAYYLAEVRQEDGSTIFVGVVPIGTMPATSFTTVSIDCGAILRDGPIDGVAVTYRSDDTGAATETIQACAASNPAAVREAARRALVEGAGALIERNERFLYVRPR